MSRVEVDDVNEEVEVNVRRAKRARAMSFLWNLGRRDPLKFSERQIADRKKKFKNGSRKEKRRKH